MSDLDTAFADVLAARITDAVAGLELGAPAARVALSYPQGSPFDLLIHAATAAEVAALAEIDPRAAWGPEDFAVSAGLGPLSTDGPLDGDGAERGRRLLCAVAAHLNQRDWSDVLPVTDDFVIYAVDTETVDLERNLPECGV